jgi:hypothetical protein
MCKETLRETIMKIITYKHDDVIAKFGAIIGQGILDAGELIFLLHKNSY